MYSFFKFPLLFLTKEAAMKLTHSVILYNIAVTK